MQTKKEIREFNRLFDIVLGCKKRKKQDETHYHGEYALSMSLGRKNKKERMVVITQYGEEKLIQYYRGSEGFEGKNVFGWSNHVKEGFNAIKKCGKREYEWFISKISSLQKTIKVINKNANTKRNKRVQ